MKSNTLALLFLTSVVVAPAPPPPPLSPPGVNPPGFVCNPEATPYSAKKTFVGCYDASSTNILTESKSSSITMTPQICANYCGEIGYVYSGIKPGGAV